MSEKLNLNKDRDELFPAQPKATTPKSIAPGVYEKTGTLKGRFDPNYLGDENKPGGGAL